VGSKDVDTITKGALFRSSSPGDGSRRLTPKKVASLGEKKIAKYRMRRVLGSDNGTVI
jgi:hypothetical protein